MCACVFLHTLQSQYQNMDFMRAFGGSEGILADPNHGEGLIEWVLMLGFDRLESGLRLGGN